MKVGSIVINFIYFGMAGYFLFFVILALNMVLVKNSQLPINLARR